VAGTPWWPVAGIDRAPPHRPATRHPTGGDTPTLVQLQRAWGNRRVSAALKRLCVQREEKVDTAPGFDARAVRNELIRSIDVTPIQIPGSYDRPQYLPRKIKVDKVVAALENRTPAQIAEIRKTYWDHEGRTLDDDLFGTAKGGTNLSIPDHARLKAMLRGTGQDSVTAAASLVGGLLSVAVPDEQALAMGAALAQSAAQEEATRAGDARAEATAAELRKLLTGDPDERERERIMALLRNPPATNGQIAGHYRRLFLPADLYPDLRRYLKEGDAERAEKLVVGDGVAADAIAVRQRLDKIAALNKMIDEQEALIRSRSEAADGVLSGALSLVGGAAVAGVPEVVKTRLEAQRAEEVAAQQAILDRARHEAMSAAGPGGQMAAGAERVRAILATPLPGKGRLGDLARAVLPRDAGMVLSALAAGSAPDLTAARLYQAYGTPAMSAAFIEKELRGLRSQAESDARDDLLDQLRSVLPQLGPDARAAAANSLTSALPTAVKQRTTAYFTRLRSSFATKVPSANNSFDAMLEHWDAEGGTTKLTELMRGEGRIGDGQAGDLRELQLALQGNHRDIETVKRVLAGKTRTQIDELVRAYDAVPGTVPLRQALSAGKASGFDAFELRELLNQPATLGGAEEATYLRDQARAEAAWGISDSGAAGAIYDWTGNEARSLMEETADTAGADLRIYQSLVAASKTDQARQVLTELRRDRARMRLDRAAYSDTIDSFRSQLATALSVAVDIAIMVVLPEAAPFLVGVAASAAGHIAANLIAYGDKYSGAMLKDDLLGAIGSAAGSKLANLALAGRAAGAGVRVADELADQLAISTSKAVVREASAYSSTSIKTLALREAKALAVETVENAAGVGGGALATGHGEIGVAEITQGVAMGRLGRAVKGGHPPAREGAAPHDPPREHPGAEPTRPQEHPEPSTRPAQEHPEPSARPAHDDAHTRPTRPYETVPEDAAGPTADVVEARRQEEFRIADERAQDPAVDQPDVKPADAGEVFQAADTNSEFEMWKIYGRLRAADPQREVGCMWNRRLEQWAVVQGGPQETLFGAAKRRLGWSRDDVDVSSHVHPVKVETGATTDLALLPSTADLRAIAAETARAGKTEAWEAVHVTVERGPGQPPEQDRAWIFYHRESHLWTVFYPLPGASRGRGRISFSEIRAFHRWRLSLMEAGPNGRARMKSPPRLTEPDPTPAKGTRRTDDEPGSLFDPRDPQWRPPEGWHLPAENRGTWDPPNSPGHGRFTPHDPGAYGLETGQSVRFVHGVPDFTGHLVETPAGHPGEIEVHGLTGDPRDAVVEQTDRQLTIEALARREGCTVAEMEQWLRDQRLTLHHQAGDTMQVVPSRLHGALHHQGSASAMRDT
jgi:hypothetical protein